MKTKITFITLFILIVAININTFFDYWRSKRIEVVLQRFSAAINDLEDDVEDIKLNILKEKCEKKKGVFLKNGYGDGVTRDYCKIGNIYYRAYGVEWTHKDIKEDSF